MIHKVSEMCDMVDRMHAESIVLRRMKYDTPKLEQNQSEINEKIAQIQYMALLVAKDVQPYSKKET